MVLFNSKIQYEHYFCRATNSGSSTQNKDVLAIFVAQYKIISSCIGGILFNAFSN